MKALFCFLTTLVCCNTLVHATHPPILRYHISDLNQEIRIPTPVWMLADKHQTLSVEDILAGSFSDAEIVEIDENTILQPTNAYWFGLELSTEEDFEDWLLHVKDVFNDRGYLFGFENVWVFHIFSDGSIQTNQSGSYVPRSQRDYKEDPTLNLIPISVKKSTKLLIWLNIRHQRTLKYFPELSIHNPNLNYPKYNETRVLIHPMIGACLMLLCIIGLSLFFFIREAVYGFFTLFTGSMAIDVFITHPQDIIGTFLIPEHPQWKIFIGVFWGLLSVVGFFEFGRRLCDLRRISLSLDRWLIRLLILSGILNFLFGFCICNLHFNHFLPIVSALFTLNLIGLVIIFFRIFLLNDFLSRTFGLSGLIHSGSYIITTLLSFIGLLDPRASINPLSFVPLGPAILGVVGLVYRFRETEASKAEAIRLQELDHTKTRLYTNITHEFRTPLTVIQGMTNKIAQQPDKWLDSGLGMIRRNSQQLLRLINQMLDLSRLESGKLSLNNVQGDMIPFLYYLIESFHSYAEMKSISLHILPEVDSLYMDHDPERLRDVISNLLSNAIKFSPEGGQVFLSTHIDGNIFQLTIKDTGIGISDIDLPHIFDRFYQADDSDTRLEEGTGIGLALTKELVELMEGSIEASSKEGEGSTFTMELPIRREAVQTDRHFSESSLAATYDFAEAESSLIVPDAHEATDLPQVLIVEDNADVVSYLTSCLEGRYQVLIARNGQAGIDLALEQVPDLIISDVMMPEKDGFELCDALKQDIRTSHVPIILLTAKADVESKLTGLRQGADAYLAKPFLEEELHIRIDNLLAVRKAMQARYAHAGQMDLPQEAEQPVEDAFIQQFRQVVMDHLDVYQLDVSMLCKEMGMARSPLHKKLKALTGMSTTEFVRFIRLSHASELLRSTDLNVSEVAYQTGFQSHNYFSIKFREVFGKTPTEWREE